MAFTPVNTLGTVSTKDYGVYKSCSTYGNECERERRFISFSTRRPVNTSSSTSEKSDNDSEAIGETQALILQYALEMGTDVIKTAHVCAWLRKKGIDKISRQAIHMALKRLAGGGRAKMLGKGWWLLDLEKLVTAKVIPKKREQKQDKSSKSSQEAQQSTNPLTNLSKKDIPKKREEKQNSPSASPLTNPLTGSLTDPLTGHGVRVLGGVSRGRGFSIVFDKVMGYVNGRFVWWISKDRGNRRLSLSGLSHFDSVSYFEVGFVSRSLRGYGLDGVFVIYFAEDVGGVVVEFRPYGGVVKKLGVDGTRRLAEAELGEVAANLFVDSVSSLPARRAVSLLFYALSSTPFDILVEALYRLLSRSPKLLGELCRRIFRKCVELGNL